MSRIIPMPYPKLTLLPGQDRRLRAGHPWVFSNELQMDAAAKALPPGEVGLPRSRRTAGRWRSPSSIRIR